MYTNLGARYRLSVHEHMRTQRNPSHALAKREFAEPCVPTCHGRDPFPFSRTSWLGVWKRGDGGMPVPEKNTKRPLADFSASGLFLCGKGPPRPVRGPRLRQQGRPGHPGASRARRHHQQPPEPHRLPLPVHQGRAARPQGALPQQVHLLLLERYALMHHRTIAVGPSPILRSGASFFHPNGSAS